MGVGIQHNLQGHRSIIHALDGMIYMQGFDIKPSLQTQVVEYLKEEGGEQRLTEIY